MKIEFFQFFHFKPYFHFQNHKSGLQNPAHSKNYLISSPPICSIVDLQQHDIAKKITFFMMIFDYENENIV